MVDHSTISPVSEPTADRTQIEAKKPFPLDEEKVEVLIKEIVRIKPQDFQAFKHALEDFVNSWDK
jgi:predicted oxidoreductase (fatty acid repression mutant protein)